MTPRHSAAVYRRRRLVALIGLLVVLLGLGVGAWALIAQPWAGDDAASQSSTDADAAGEGADATGPSPSETPGIAPCQAENIRVEAVAADSYAAGQDPEFSISLTNTGDEDCTINVGTDAQQFVVMSGQDEWWRSTDCQQERSPMVGTLAAGQTATSAEPVVWDRTRSTPTTCESESRPRAAGGGASYHLKVSIGGFDSEKTKQFMLM